MPNPIKTIEVPFSVTAPSGSPTGPEWAAVQSDVATASAAAAIANSRVFDVRQYGSIFTSDDSATFQAAINAAYAAGGGTVTGPAGSYQFLHGIKLAHKVSIAMPSSASTTFDFTAMLPANGAVDDDGGTKHCILVEGPSLTSLPNLGANVSLHSKTVTFASAPGLVQGDWFCIYNTVDYSFNAERDYYRDGEWCQVKSVSGATVTLTKPTFSTYVVADCTNHKLYPMESGIRGVTCKFPPSTGGAVFRRCTGIDIDDAKFLGTNIANLAINMSVNVSLSNLDARSMAANAETSLTNYGLIIGSVQHVSITNPNFETERHGFTTGIGTAGPGGVPCRDVKIIGGTIGSNGVTVNGCDLHGHVEWMTFQNVTMPAGLHISGDHIRVANCDIWMGPAGWAAIGSYFIGRDIELVDNTYRATGAYSMSGLVALSFTGEVKRGGHTRVSGDMSLRSLRSGSGVTYGLRVTNTGNEVTGDLSVNISGEATSVTIGETIWGVSIEAAGGSTYYRYVDIVANLDGMGVRVQQCYDATIHDSRVFGAPMHGIYANNPATAHGSAPTIRSINNVVRGCGNAGIQLGGPGTGVNGTAVSHGDEVMDCNTSGSASLTTGADILIGTWKWAIYRDATVGSTQGTPTPTRASAFSAIGTLWRSPEVIIGALTTYSTGVTTTNTL